MDNKTLEARLEAGRVLFTQKCEFVISAAAFDQLPDSELPEIAFAGRSNVGKSSLLNALAGRKNLARTSNTPGRTQQVNFFNLGERLMLTDLPGYGYARATKSIVEKWTRLIKSYLKGRVQLRRVCLLIDSRHGMKDTDREAMDLMDAAAVGYQIILTKCDKVKASELENLLEKTHKEIAKHVAAHPDIMVTSSFKSQGILELRTTLADLANA
jgi:GTP-binding protein